MTRALVTGATGFIGRHLVELLREAGHDVVCLVRPSSDRSALEALGCSFAVGDITEASSMEAPVADVDVVFHLAAMLKQPWHADFMATNADGVRAVAAACAAAESPPVLVTVSSIAAAGPSDGDRPRTEDDPPAPVSRYGRSKLGGEEAAREHAKRVPISIIRPPAVIGERDRTSLPLFRAAARGVHAVPGDGSARLAMVHVLDLAAAIVAAAERGERLAAPGPDAPVGQGVYFAAATEQPTVRELGPMLAAAVGRERVRVLPTPAPLSKLVGGIAEGLARLRDKPSIVNYDKMIEANAGSWICSTDKARTQLGWEPQATLGERLEQTGAWYRKEGWL